jgi:hypothetical protein
MHIVRQLQCGSTSINYRVRCQNIVRQVNLTQLDSLLKLASGFMYSFIKNVKNEDYLHPS